MQFCPGSVSTSNSGGEPLQDHRPWRPPNEREGDIIELSPRFDTGDAHTRHPNDLSSRGFRRGTLRGHPRGHDSPPHRERDNEESKQTYTHPFLNKLSSRGFKSGAQGLHGNALDSRDPRRVGLFDEPQQGRGPEDPRGE